MGIIIRQSVYNALFTYIGIGLGVILTIFLFPHILTPEQYGLTRVLLSLALMGSHVAQLGTKNTILRFFPYFKTRSSGFKSFLFWSLLIPLIGICILVIVIYAGKPTLIEFYQDRSALFVDYYWYTVPLLIFIVYFEVLNAHVTALYDSVTGSIVKEVILRLAIIGVLTLYYFGWYSFPQFLRYFVFIYSIQPIILLCYLVIKGKFKISPSLSFISPSLRKEMLNYSMYYTFIGGLTSIVIGNIDILMLGSMSGLGNTAIYFVAFSVGSVISVSKRSIGKIATPIISNAYKNNNLREIAYIYQQSSLNNLIIGTLLFVGIWANLHNLFEILPQEYGGGTLVVIIIGIGQLLDMSFGVNGTIISISKYYRFNLYSNLLFLITIIATNLALIPVLGIVGAAIASTFSLLIYNMVKSGYVWKKLHIHPFKSSIYIICLVGALTLLVGLSIPKFTSVYIDIAIRSSIMAAIYTLSIYYFNISENFNNLVHKIIDYIVSIFP